MADRINSTYIRQFFSIPDTPEGNEELAEIEKRLERISFENGMDICTIGAESDGMYFIDSGTAVVLNDQGDQVNLLHKGNYFGEYAALTGEKRLSTVRSLGRSVVYRLSNEDAVYFISKHPDIYGILMKRVYSQVSGKHAQLVALSGVRRGVLRHPSNAAILSGKQVVVHYGILIALFIAAIIFIPEKTTGPVFLVPLMFMPIYAILTRRTIESLLVSTALAALLAYRSGIFTGFTDAVEGAMASPGNIFTVLVMALIGAMVNLITVSGGVTAFEKTALKIEKSPRSIYFTSMGIMAATSIDDGLNMLAASYASYLPAKKHGIVREKLALLYSMLPTVLSSFLPISLWGIYVIGTLNSVSDDGAVLFCESIPFNLFSIITLISMILFAFGKLPLTRRIKKADKRYKEGGTLWPDGSEKYLSVHETEVWGRKSNVMFPILVMVISSVAFRSFASKSFVLDSAVGLVAALTFMFLLYTFRGVMPPEQFIEHMIDGIAGTVPAIIMYIITMCFSSLLNKLNLVEYFEDTIDVFGGYVFLLPAAVFICSLLLTVVLGSSWAMYAIAFPVVLSLTRSLGLSPVIFVGAIAGAGIAGEKLSMFTAESINIGIAVGINPKDAFRVRLSYSIIFSALAAGGYVLLGLML
ncbi:MAG: cyclic nucleotide-binding domain-containing protein [Lachnospiraceae bacterium]|nr:cyclic nucleotide-binding domain-containing protein [Lachnospiraceae bacterium]